MLKSSVSNAVKITNPRRTKGPLSFQIFLTTIHLVLAKDDFCHLVVPSINGQWLEWSVVTT